MTLFSSSSAIPIPGFGKGFVRILLLALGALTALPGFGQVSPPLKKAWETHVEDQLSSAIVGENRVFYGTTKEFGALDLKTGKTLWKQTLTEKQYFAYPTLSGGALYVSVGDRGLLVCDSATGNILASAPGTYYGIDPLAIGPRVFTTLRKGFISAVDAKTLRPLWTTDLRRPQPKSDDSSKMFGPSFLARLDDRSVLAGTHDAEVFRLDATTGKPRWKWSLPLPKYRGEVRGIAAGPRIFVTAGENVVALEPKTGRALWKFVREEDDFYYPPVERGGTVFALAQSGTLFGLDARTGKPRWTKRLSTQNSPHTSPPISGEGKVLVGVDTTLRAFAPSGKELWTWSFPDGFFETPQLIDTRGYVFTNGSAFHRFVPGTPSGLPTDSKARRALAQKLAARLGKLTGDEERTLEKLGDDAFAILLPLTHERLRLYLAAKSKTTKRRDAFTEYSAFSETAQSLARVMQPKFTADLLALLKETDGVTGDQSARSLLIQILAGRSAMMVRAPEGRTDARLVIPLFLDILRKGNRVAGFGSALDYVSRSAHPDALAFLKKSLADPKDNPIVRQTGVLSLVRVGGTAFVPDVLAARDAERGLPTLAEYLRIDALPTTVPKSDREPSEARGTLLKTGKDAEGREWGLLKSGILGNYDDLWLVRREGGRWSDPVFLGEKADASGDWVARYTTDVAIRTDTDGDGWTDLVEKRLGSDPAKPDTDGDGLKDSADANPLVAPRPLNDTEQVLYAAFEARFRFDKERSTPCLVELPEGIAPMELPSWGWITLPDREKAPLAAFVGIRGKGVGSVDFRAPTQDFAGAALTSRKDAPPIFWNADRTRAKLHLVTYFNGLDSTGYDIELRKFGKDWIVIRSQMMWIS